MAHYAKIDANDRVVEVIVATENFINSGAVGDPAQWIQTSYNTVAGVHQLGGTPFRKNYAAAGMIYDRVRDAFRYEQPQDGTTYVLNEFSCIWERPVAPPAEITPGKFIHWDEATQNWIETDSPMAGE